MTNILQPAEWEPHSCVWMAWPYDDELWGESHASAEAEFVDFVEAILDISEDGEVRGDRVCLLIANSDIKKRAIERLPKVGIEYFVEPYWDIWLRDTAPIFCRDAVGDIVAKVFTFNGWGRKYLFANDVTVGERIASHTGVERCLSEFVLEGGAIDVDGQGTALTSRQCLLNPNRNGTITEKEVEDTFARELGISKTIWVSEGLLNDHTDGHIDTIVRFLAPGVVACMRAEDSSDPNFETYEKVHAELESAVDASGKSVRVVTLPSPGKITSRSGDILPASYLNFYITNSRVIVPTYGVEADTRAVEVLGERFPGREVIGRSALAILSGGGAFHCITQQQPT